MKKYHLLLVFPLLFGCNFNAQNKINEERDSLLIEIERLRLENDSLLKQMEQDQFERNIPAEEVETALRNQSEIIPMEAVLGGTMRFGNITILKENLIIADYNDGHVEGSAIFKFEKIADSLRFNVVHELD